MMSDYINLSSHDDVEGDDLEGDNSSNRSSPNKNKNKHNKNISNKTLTPSVRDFFDKLNATGTSSEVRRLRHIIDDDDDGHADHDSKTEDEDEELGGGGGVVQGPGNRSGLREYLRALIEKEFPTRHDDGDGRRRQRPTARGVINVGPARIDGASRYDPGMWVEILGPDMRWRLDMITRVVRRVPDDDDESDDDESGPRWTYTYNAGVDRDIAEEDLRSPEEGLRIVFGSRPWLFQKWAVLRLEEKMRFQEGHEDDFSEFNATKYALKLWEQEWLDHPSNEDFRKRYDDPRVGPFGRSELVNHIMKPFQLMDAIRKQEEEWNFKDSTNINIFTHAGVLGAGFLVPITVLCLQILIPFVLVVVVRHKHTCPADVKDADPNDAYYAKIMCFFVFTYYLLTVLPNAYDNLFVVVGSDKRPYSRLISLREITWTRGMDSKGQAIGLAVDMFMNTAFEIMLLVLNIFVITRSHDAVEVLLDALAFLFIADIDEELAQSRWWDPDGRWIAAGAVEVVIQNTFDEPASSASNGCCPTSGAASLAVERFERYDVPSREALLDACDGDPRLTRCDRVAERDGTDQRYASGRERILRVCAEIAYDTGNLPALAQYRKEPVYASNALESSLGLSRAMFERFANHRTWSRWDRVLFLPPVPDEKDVFASSASKHDSVGGDDDDHRSVLHPRLDHVASGDDGVLFPNHYPEEEGLSYRAMLLQQAVRVLTLRSMWDSLVHFWGAGRYCKLPRQVVEGLVEWAIYVVYLAFPLYFAAAYYGIAYTAVTKQCFPNGWWFLWSM